MLFVASALPFDAAAASAAQNKNFQTWSGYIAEGATFAGISAQWVQPAVTCPAKNARASIWVGFDGDGNGTVEQVGTIAMCASAGATPTYRAWWEMFSGSTSRGRTNVPISPGDTISASVRYVRGKYELKVRDETNGHHISTTKSCTSTCERSSAEWIVERAGNGKYALANYGSLQFTATAVAAATPGPRPAAPHHRGMGNLTGPGDSAFTVIHATMVHAGTVLSSCTAFDPRKPLAPLTCTWHAAE